MAQPTPPTDRQYSSLLAFRTELRRFLRWSEHRAADAGLTGAQHQLLLAIRGHLDPAGPSIGEIANYLCARHHSVVQLIDRTEQAGLVARNREDGKDRRVVRLTLTEAGRRTLAQLSAAHLEELGQVAALVDTLTDLTAAIPEAG
ncbi:MarR family transcriptional regulator [Nocardia stercoris]|uniref:MarR family transcriptional regulator n=2 Tax=Nocardia stercoris TaxID=2483361 RepID=A0A3M2KY54_9NOCA|nr:MarR family transcriptional regulator [Nocardia stercoris]